MRQRIGYFIWVIVGLLIGVGSLIYSTQSKFEFDSLNIKLIIIGFVVMIYGLIGTLFPNLLPRRKPGAARRRLARGVVAIVVLVGLFIGGIMLALNSPPNTKQAILDGLFKCQTQMQHFSPADHSFTVNMPGFDAPTPVSGSTGSITPDSYFVDCGLNSYFVNYVSVPAGLVSTGSDANVVLQTQLNDIQASMKIDHMLISSQSTTLLGQYPGLRYEIEIPNPSSTGILISKTVTISGTLYLVNDRLYNLFVAAPTTGYSQIRATIYTSSLKILTN